MKVKIKAYNMPIDEINHFLDRLGYTIGKSLTPDNYDYRPKFVHYLEDVWGNRIILTAKSYNNFMKSIKD